MRGEVKPRWRVTGNELRVRNNGYQRPEISGRRTKVRNQSSDVGSTEVRSQRPEIRDRMSEDEYQRLDDRDRRPEIGDQKSEA